MISEPRRRISSCKSPTALCSLSSERNEFEQTSSASAAVLWAAVVRSGRISWSTTGTPRAAICQAASDPASPPPMTCTARRRASVMGRDYLGPPRVLQIGGWRGAEALESKLRASAPRLESESARRAGAFIEGLGISAVSAVPRDPRDVRSGDADIGQFAVAELVELFQARVVAPPSAEEVDDCDQHDCYLSPGPGPGNLSSHDVNKVPWCVALDIMLRRSYARIAYLKSLVLHKDQVIRPAGRGDKDGADLGLKCTPSDWALWAGRAGAPEALPPTRDDLPVVDIVRNATLERGDHRARGPGHALP